MVERKLLVLEAYLERSTEEEMWRVKNIDGLNWHEDPRQFTFVLPSLCKNNIIVEVTKVQKLLEANGDTWKWLGIISRAPNGNILKNDGDRYRKVVLEKVSCATHLCSTCGRPCDYRQAETIAQAPPQYAYHTAIPVQPGHEPHLQQV